MRFEKSIFKSKMLEWRQASGSDRGEKNDIQMTSIRTWFPCKKWKKPNWHCSPFGGDWQFVQSLFMIIICKCWFCKGKYSVPFTSVSLTILFDGVSCGIERKKMKTRTFTIECMMMALPVLVYAGAGYFWYDELVLNIKAKYSLSHFVFAAFFALCFLVPACRDISSQFFSEFGARKFIHGKPTENFHMHVRADVHKYGKWHSFPCLPYRGWRPYISVSMSLRSS